MRPSYLVAIAALVGSALLPGDHLLTTSKSGQHTEAGNQLIATSRPTLLTSQLLRRSAAFPRADGSNSNAPLDSAQDHATPADRHLSLSPPGDGATETGEQAAVAKGVEAPESTVGTGRPPGHNRTFVEARHHARVRGFEVDVVVYPGESIQELADANPEGTVFLIKAGVHRMQMVEPKNGNVFVGEPGAVLNGSRVLTEFEKVGSAWRVSGQTQQGESNHGLCGWNPDGSDYPGCRFPEDVFIDDVMMWQVMSLAEVGPGKWYFDYANDMVYIGDDPTGRKVEISVTRHAFVGRAYNGGPDPARDVTIQGLVIEKYATPSQYGAIHAARGNSGTRAVNWRIIDNEVRLNHAVGIFMGDQCQVIGNFTHHNGQYGIAGDSPLPGSLVEDNEISYNRLGAGYHPNDSGGTKFANTRDLIVRGNYVHHNYSKGLWTDSDNVGTIYEDNLVTDNGGPGIMHEVSYNAIIRNNQVINNGWDQAVWLWGSGILVSSSSDVEIYGNTVVGNPDGIGAVQQDRGSGKYGPHQVSNLYVHDNFISVGDEGTIGVAQDNGDTTIWQRNNRFENNTYEFLTVEHHFVWNNTYYDHNGWQSLGHDLNGTFTYI